MTKQEVEQIVAKEFNKLIKQKEFDKEVSNVVKKTTGDIRKEIINIIKKALDNHYKQLWIKKDVIMATIK